MEINDQLGRPLRDLRFSLTDRCNFRCLYCMPKEDFGPGYEFLGQQELLTFDEIERLARLFAGLGVHKIRLTGGEPLLRAGVERLVGRLAAVPEIDELTMTTNGSLLTGKAPALADAGLNRVSVSLDALDNRVFAAMNDVGFPVEKVLEGIEAAGQAGLRPVKVNMVVKRSVNDREILPLVRYFRGTGHILRFIEYMDVGTTSGWRIEEVVSAAEIRDRIDAVYPIEPLEANYHGEVANRYRFLDGGGEIGIIASVTQPFCGDCTRLRLSADGKAYTCLFAADGQDMRAPLRAGSSDAEILYTIRALWGRREDRYSEQRRDAVDQPKVMMHFVGG